MAEEMSPVQRDFRAAMANLSAAVNIVTTDGISGRAGITVSAVCSVTDDLLAVDRAPQTRRC